MKSKLSKWNEHDKWRDDPTNGVAYAGEIIYAVGNEDIQAGAGEDACRVVLFYDKTRRKAALLHTNDLNGTEYKTMLHAIRPRRFNAVTTQVYLCGDEGEEEFRSWNDEIERHIQAMGYNVIRISRGREKNVLINPGNDLLSITDKDGRDLMK